MPFFHMWRLKQAATGRLEEEPRVKIRQVSIGARVRPLLEHEKQQQQQLDQDQSIKAHPSSKCIVVQTGAKARKQRRASSRTRREEGEEQNVSGGGTHAYKAKKFYFDYVFDENSTQAQVYRDVAAAAVQDSLKGCNAVVLAYGQTGAGKTYSICGPDFDSNKVTEEDASQLGMVPRALHELFEHIDDRKGTWIFHVHMSYLQLYMNKAYDLLQNQRKPIMTNKHTPNKGQELDIRDGPNGSYVDGLSSLPVTSIHEALELLEEGERKKVKASTALNTDSSRSHTILMVDVYRVMRGENRYYEDFGYGSGTFSCRGKLTFFDLAGSERTHATGASGKQLDEAKVINKSLSALGNVVAALSSAAAEASQNVDLSASAHGIASKSNSLSSSLVSPGRQSQKYFQDLAGKKSRSITPNRNGQVPKRKQSSAKRFIPWRDSKLTKLLQASLISASDPGHASVSLLLNLSPNKDHVGEALSTMMFGARARGMAEEPLEFAAAFGAQSLGFLPEALSEVATSQFKSDGDEEQLRTTISPLKSSSSLSKWDGETPSSQQYYRRLALALQRRYDTLEDKSRQAQSSLLRQYEEATKYNNELKEQVNVTEMQLQDAQTNLQNMQEAMEQLYDERTEFQEKVQELEQELSETVRRAEAAEELAVALAGSETGDDTSEVIGWSIQGRSQESSRHPQSTPSVHHSHYFNGSESIIGKYSSYSTGALHHERNIMSQRIEYGLEEQAKYHAEALDNLINQSSSSIVRSRILSHLWTHSRLSPDFSSFLSGALNKSSPASAHRSKEITPSSETAKIEVSTRKPKLRDVHTGTGSVISTVSPPPANRKVPKNDGAQRAESSYQEIRAALSRAYELFENSSDNQTHQESPLHRNLGNSHVSSTKERAMPLSSTNSRRLIEPRKQLTNPNDPGQRGRASFASVAGVSPGSHHDSESNMSRMSSPRRVSFADTPGGLNAPVAPQRSAPESQFSSKSQTESHPTSTQSTHQPLQPSAGSAGQSRRLSQSSNSSNNVNSNAPHHPPPNQQSSPPTSRRPSYHGVEANVSPQPPGQQINTHQALGNGSMDNPSRLQAQASNGTQNHPRRDSYNAPQKPQPPRNSGRRDSHSARQNPQSPQSPGRQDDYNAPQKPQPPQSSGRGDGHNGPPKPLSPQSSDNHNAPQKPPPPQSPGRRDSSNTLQKPQPPKSPGRRDSFNAPQKPQPPQSPGRRDSSNASQKPQPPQSPGRRGSSNTPQKVQPPQSSGRQGNYNNSQGAEKPRPPPTSGRQQSPQPPPNNASEHSKQGLPHPPQPQPPPVKPRPPPTNSSNRS